MIDESFWSARVRDAVFVSSAVALTLGACGGKVDFVPGTGGAGGAATATSTQTGLGGSTSTVVFGTQNSNVVAETATASVAVVASSSSAGGPSMCDNSGTCDTCQGCALAPGAQCSDALNACYASPQCSMLISCYQGCAANDQTCFNDCATKNMNGGDAYQTLSVCVLCQACFNDCSSAGGQGCPMPD